MKIFNYLIYRIPYRKEIAKILLGREIKFIKENSLTFGNGKPASEVRDVLALLFEKF